MESPPGGPEAAFYLSRERTYNRPHERAIHPLARPRHDFLEGDTVQQIRRRDRPEADPLQPDLPEAGLGRARSRRDLGQPAGGCEGGHRGGPDRSDQVCAMGIANQRETTVVWDRARGNPSTTPSCGSADAPPIFATSCARSASRTWSARGRARPRPLFFGTKLMWLFDRCRDFGPEPSGARYVRDDDSWLIYKLTRRPPDRSDQREQDLAIQYKYGRMGRGAAQRTSRFPPHLAPSGPSSGVLGIARRNPWGGDTRRRGRRRPAGGALRPRVLRPGEAKNTYGTGCFTLMNTGPIRGLEARPPDDGGLGSR